MDEIPDPYRVLLLVELPLSAADAATVHDLHADIDGVQYHLLLPVEDATATLPAAMAGLGSVDGLALATPPVETEQLEDLQDELDHQATAELQASLQHLAATGAHVSGELVHQEPVQALADAVAKLQAAEAIVLTGPHMVAEFFHVDWSSRARRKLGVPVLHLFEHTDSA